MQKLAKDLTIDLKADKPGAIAKATEAIANAGINLDGYTESKGTLHTLTDDAPRTRRALEDAGFQVIDEKDVLLIDVDDRPGTAAGIFRRIADADVNVDFSYLSAHNRMVIGAKNVKKLTEVLSMETAGSARR